MTEFGFIDKICARFAELPLNGFEGIGDDCAVLPVADGDALLFTADLLNEGVHFLRRATSARELGGKALAVNLSDIAAMGGRPVATLLSLALPPDAGETWAAEFMEGYRALSERYGVVGVHMFCPHTPDAAAHCRNFAPLYAIPEEAATGTSNGALTYYLYRRGLTAAGAENRFVQGEKMGKPSEILSRLTDGGDGVKVQVGGRAVLALRCELL